jgi:radical SAM protein with 4Fe4S-binding SPASM domain
MKDNNTFCIYPWIHLNTWPDGKVFQCCLTGWQNSIGNLEHNSLEEIWNNDYMKDLRKHMLGGKKHWSCKKCYEQEEKGINSSRVSANKNFKHHIPRAFESTDSNGHNHDFKLVYWDFRFSNICNFKCRMCGSFLSSKWAEEEQKNGGGLVNEKVIHIDNHTKENLKLSDYIDNFIKDVEEVYFAGGEPLLMDDHYYVLQKLIEVGNTKCKIRYNTNLSKLKYKNYDCLEYWKHFERVSIFASIDDIGSRAEYARNGTVWEKINSNLRKIISDAPDVELQTSTTVNIWNIMYIPEIVDYLIDLGIPPYHIAMNNILTNPAEYHINILPDEMKNKIRKNLQDHLNSMNQETRKYFDDKYQSILNFLNESPDEIDNIRQKFKRRIIRLDDIRNENFVKIFPVYEEWFNSL